MSSEKVLTLTKANFEEKVLKSDKPAIVDFWAAWCGPCRAVAPIIEELAGDYDGKAIVGKVNVDEEGELAARYRIMSIPTVMLFKDGQIAERIIGARPKSEFSGLLEKYL